MEQIYIDNGLFPGNELQDIPNIYAYMQKLITDPIIVPEYTMICRRFTSPEYVRKSVFSGEKRIVQSYKARTTNGIQWVTFSIMVEPDCELENFMVFLLVSNKEARFLGFLTLKSTAEDGT